MRSRIQCALFLVLFFAALILRAAELPMFSGIARLRIDSGDVSGDPIAFQFTIDNKFIGVKLEPLGKKPWTYETKWDSRTVDDGLHVLSGFLWYGAKDMRPIHQQTIRVRQPVGKMAMK